MIKTRNTAKKIPYGFLAKYLFTFRFDLFPSNFTRRTNKSRLPFRNLKIQNLMNRENEARKEKMRIEK